jgi:hypothetical protein
MKSVLDDERTQTFRPRTHARSDPGRAATHDQYIEHFIVSDVKIEAEQSRNLVRCRVRHCNVAPKNYGGLPSRN